MGMYATICGQELKFTGLLAKVANDLAVREDGAVILERPQVKDVFIAMTETLEQGLSLIDASSLQLLFEWLTFSDERELIFV